MALDMTSFDAALKQWYTDDKVMNMVYKDNPLLAMLSKMESFKGKNLPIPIIYGNPQNRSASFAVAVAGNTNSQLDDFVLTRNHDYSVANIDNETLEASQGNSAAFLEAATVEIDGAIQAATRSLAIALYGTGSGSIGRAPASGGPFTSTTLTLSNPEDVTNFEVGMELVFSTANGGGSVKSGSVTVVGVDRDNGVLTTDALTAIDSGTGVANSDWIFPQGDYDAKLKGLRAWLPDSTPSATPFFGVVRTADATRLGGIRYDGSAMPIEEALISAAARVAREGGRPDKCFMNYSKYADLEKALGSKVQYIDMKINAEIAFRGIQINGPRGPIQVVPDQNCPSERCFMLQMDMWKLYSLGKAPKIIDTDGLRLLRNAGSDSVQCRVGYYAQLGSRAPGFNANVQLS